MLLCETSTIDFIFYSKGFHLHPLADTSSPLGYIISIKYNTTQYRDEFYKPLDWLTGYMWLMYKRCLTKRLCETDLAYVLHRVQTDLNWNWLMLVDLNNENETMARLGCECVGCECTDNTVYDGLPHLDLSSDNFFNESSQWETTLYCKLHCNVVFHWLGAYTKWYLPLSMLINCYLCYVMRSLGDYLLSSQHGGCWWLGAYSATGHLQPPCWPSARSVHGRGASKQHGLTHGFETDSHKPNAHWFCGGPFTCIV